MLHIVRWDASAKKAETVPWADLPISHADVGDHVYWIDMDNPTPEEEGRVLQAFHAVQMPELAPGATGRQDPAAVLRTYRVVGGESRVPVDPGRGLGADCALGPDMLVRGHLLTMNAFEPVFWLAIVHVLAGMLRDQDVRPWPLLGLLVGVALLISVAFSLFLARTIVRPLRMLVRAAVRVRLGRERAVVVPRLPERRDEIGLLARALSDMSLALTQRIDAVGAFAADVAHELKNPLASLRSALDTLERVEDADLRQQLTAIAAHDVRRIDRLVTEIADASRIDAELSRATFEQLDLHALVSELVGARERRGANAGCQVRVLRAGAGTTLVAGDPARLRAVEGDLELPDRCHRATLGLPGSRGRPDIRDAPGQVTGDQRPDLSHIMGKCPDV